MDMKKLLESIDSMQRAERHPTGPKFTGYWKGSDKATPGKHMIGGDEQQESAIPDLKQLKKVAQESETEWKLKEMWANFNEEDLGTHPKRPARASDRHPRGHEPHPRYKTVKTEESMSDKDIELQDYRSMSHKEFQNAYKMTKTEWINKNKSLVIQNPSIKKALGLDEAANPAQQAAIAIAMKKAGRKPKNEQEELNQPRRPEVIDDLPKTPQDPNKGTVVKDYNRLPKDPNAPQKYPTVTDEGAEEDPVVARVVKQMRPGLTGLDMGNEAFLYFAYELGKQRARDAWEDYLPAIRSEYEKGLVESSYYGPVEARWMVKLSDDEGDHLKTYVDKFPSLSSAKKAFKNTPYATDFKYKPVKKDQVEEAIDSDIVQPMGQDSFNRGGFNPIRDKEDYLKRRSTAWNLLNATNTDPQTKAEAKQQILDLDKQARAKKYIQSESRGHNIVKKFLKDRGAWDNNPFAKDTTPSIESKNWVIYDKSSKKPYMAFDSKDQAHDFLFDKLGFDKDYTVLHKSELPLEEYATATPGGSSTQANTAISMTPVSSNDPTAVKQAQQTAQATQAIKSATGASAPSQAIVKSLNQLTQGKPLGSMDAKNLDPIADVAAAAMSGKNPALTNQFKTLANQVRQLQQPK